MLTYLQQAFSCERILDLHGFGDFFGDPDFAPDPFRLWQRLGVTKVPVHY